MPVNKCGFGHTRNGQTVGLEYLMLYKKKVPSDVVQIPFLANRTLCQHITFTSGRNSGAADVRERRASAFFNKWRHVWYSHRSKMKKEKKKVPFNAGLTCLNKVQMRAEWCEVRWRFWKEMIKFHDSDSELGIIWLCCMYSLLDYLELVCQRSISSVAATLPFSRKQKTNKQMQTLSPSRLRLSVWRIFTCLPLLPRATCLWSTLTTQTKCF